MRSFLGVLLVACAFVFFSSCGDDNGSGSSSVKTDDQGDYSSDLDLADGKKISCVDTLESVVAITLDEGYRKCIHGEWVPIKDSDVSEDDAVIGVLHGTSSSSAQFESSSSSMKVVSSSSEKVRSSSSPTPSSSSSLKAESSSSVKLASSSSLEKVVSSSSQQHSSSSSAVVDLVECDDGSLVVEAGKCGVSSSSSSSSVHIPVVSIGTFVDSRDKHSYKMVSIDDQTWMAENLNYFYDAQKSPCYEKNSSNCATYGRLYTWGAAVDSSGYKSQTGKGCGYNKTCAAASETSTAVIQGVCPSGWHLPSQKEWIAFVEAVGGFFGTSKYIKSATGWGAGGNGDNAYGFNALPSGYLMFDEYLEIGLETAFWSATEEDKEYAYGLGLVTGENIQQSIAEKKSALSIRCKRNAIVEISSSSADYVSSSSVFKGNVDPSSVETGTLVDSRDGKIYKTVKIGSLNWMAQNLNFKYVANGDSSHCAYNKIENCDKYGRLYLWGQAVDSLGIYSTDAKGCGLKQVCGLDNPVRGVCPDGWHIPTKDEWDSLITAAGGIYVAGDYLRGGTQWHDECSDDYGFSVYPAGRYFMEESYDNVGGSTDFWTATEENGRYSFAVSFNDCSYVSLYRSYKSMGFSLRCVEDYTMITPTMGPVDDGYDASAKTLTDARDGKVYKTVTIGTQVWMAQNLNFNYETWPRPKTNDSLSFCFDGKTTNCDTYGRLYLWSAAMDSSALFGTEGRGCGAGEICYKRTHVRGVCPLGWHLPSLEDVKTLESTIGAKNAGSYLKSTKGWYDGGDGINKYGFNALPVGCRSVNGAYVAQGDAAYFWLSSPNGPSTLDTERESEMRTSHNWELRYSSNKITQTISNKTLGYSVRCLKDE